MMTYCGLKVKVPLQIHSPLITNTEGLNLETLMEDWDLQRDQWDQWDQWDRSCWCCVKEWSVSVQVRVPVHMQGRGDLIKWFLPASGRGALPVNPVHTLSWSGGLGCVLSHWLPQSD